MIDLGIVTLEPDPDDRRHMVVSLTETGKRMQDAQQAMDALSEQIAGALGQDRFENMLAALEADWGSNVANGADRRAGQAFTSVRTESLEVSSARLSITRRISARSVSTSSSVIPRVATSCTSAFIGARSVPVPWRAASGG
jgi:hypothetical protein